MKKPQTLRAAIITILMADISMSLDNVLAVAGAARDHISILVFGLIFSVILMGVAATWVSKLIHRHRWIGYLGWAIILYVAIDMTYRGFLQLYPFSL